MCNEPGAPAALTWAGTVTQPDRARDARGDANSDTTISESTHLNTWWYADAALEAPILELLHGIEFTATFDIDNMIGRPPFSRHSEFAIACDVDIDVRILEAWQLEESSDMSGRRWGVHLHSEADVSEEFGAVVT